MRADPTEGKPTTEVQPATDDQPAESDGSATEPQDPTALDVLVRRVQRPPGRPSAPRRELTLRTLTDLVPSTVPRGFAVVALLVAVAAGFFGWQLVARPAPIEQRMPMASSEPSGASPAEGSGDRSGAPRAADGESGASPSGSGDGTAGRGAEVTLHVAGAVNRPGLVSVPEGSRVADAAAAAGGLGVAADVERVNLAATVVDGSRVFIPAVGQEIPAEVPVVTDTSAGGGEPSAEAPVDLNTADEEALEALPGVGPATAAAIVTHREKNGRFTSVESLLDVRGIGDAKLDAMRDLVTVR